MKEPEIDRDEEDEIDPEEMSISEYFSKDRKDFVRRKDKWSAIHRDD